AMMLSGFMSPVDSMPDWMRKQFEGKQAKAEFVKKYIADELFYRKSLKLGYDKDPDVLKKVKAAEKELMVNKVLESELKDKIKIEDEDVKNFFAAHAADYEQKEAVKVSLIKAGMKEIADRVITDVKAGKDFNALARKISLDTASAKDGGRFPGWVRKGEDDLGIGDVEKISSALFGKKPGEILPPFEAGGSFYVFRIDETRPLKMPPFDEVKEKVKNDYYMQKLKASYQGLLDQILKSSDVKLYLDAAAGEVKK
ncbi:MAG: peptidyl-prolyl cis-trans isomerase, partial [Pseudomonadota bacterium]